MLSAECLLCTVMRCYIDTNIDTEKRTASLQVGESDRDGTELKLFFTCFSKGGTYPK